MKNIVFALLLAIPAFSYAGVTADSSWDQIRRNASVEVDTPRLVLGGGKYHVQIWNVCVAGNKIFSKGQFEVCTKTAGRDGDTCLASKMVRPSTPMTYMKNICTRWEGRDGDTCTRTKSRMVKIATSYMINVHRSLGGRDGDEMGRVLFTKRFDIPACM